MHFLEFVIIPSKHFQNWHTRIQILVLFGTICLPVSSYRFAREIKFLKHNYGNQPEIMKTIKYIQNLYAGRFFVNKCLLNTIPLNINFTLIY